jgi:L-histidine N-alpha-methyltransferase
VRAAVAIVRRSRCPPKAAIEPPLTQPLPLQTSLPPRESTAALLWRCLREEPATIPPRFFYDDLGSRLFAAITALDEYYPTRTEAALLAEHLPAIAATGETRGCTLIDLGAGDCGKAPRLLQALQPATYVAVDISAGFLAESLALLRPRFPGVEMLGVGTDFSARITLPPAVPMQRRLFFYPGSSIGNFTPEDAVVFLRSVREAMAADGRLWIGVDLQKPIALLERAYDDDLGVTAAFNRNVLRHVNRLAETDFRLGDWRHIARYDRLRHRVEMHLEAVRDVVVRWPGGGRAFAAGDRIHTENSYKHTVPGFTELLAAAGLGTVGHWTDAAGWFAFFVAEPRG